MTADWQEKKSGRINKLSDDTICRCTPPVSNGKQNTSEMQKSEERLAQDQGTVTGEPRESGLQVCIVSTVGHMCQGEVYITAQLTFSSHPPCRVKDRA